MYAVSHRNLNDNHIFHIPETKTYRQDIQRLDRERYDCWGIFGAGIGGVFWILVFGCFLFNDEELK